MPSKYERRIEALEGAIRTTCERQCTKCFFLVWGSEEPRDHASVCDGNPKSLTDILESLPSRTIEQALVRSGELKGTSDDELRAYIATAPGEAADELH